MIEKRAYVSDIASIKTKVGELGGIVQGKYAFRDHIFQPVDSFGKDFDLNKECIRIREYQETNWDQKLVEFVRKVKFAKGETRVVALKRECDSVEEAMQFLNPQDKKLFSFGRKGVEYRLLDLRIFLEEIEGLPLSKMCTNLYTA